MSHGRTIGGQPVRFILPDSSNVDRFHLLLDRDPDAPTGIRDVAVLPWPVDPLLVLRLVEAGVHHVTPAGTFVHHDLADRASLRRRLGLRSDGDTATFLRLVGTLPDRWWFASGDDEPTLRLGPRLEEVRQDAVDVAGLPVSLSGPPSIAVVRRVICRLWCAVTAPPCLVPAALTPPRPASR